MLKYAAEHREQRRKAYKEWVSRNRQYRQQYTREWRKSHPEAVRETQKKAYSKHIEKRRAHNKEYRIQHREEINAKLKEYYRRTYALKREWLLQQTKEYSKAHPEIRRKCYRNWVKKNPHYHSTKSAERRIKLLALPTDDAASTVIKNAKAKKTFVCYYCKKRFPRSKMHIDHIVPVSKNGTHTADNLCISCKTCNLCKNAKPLNKLTFIQQQLLPL